MSAGEALVTEPQDLLEPAAPADDPATVDAAVEDVDPEPSALPIGSVDDILNAPSDCVEETIEVPEWGCSVRVKALTAAAQSAVKQKSIILAGRSPDLAWAEMEKAQFQRGVIDPQFSEKQVVQLHMKSGPGFARVIAAIDRISGTNKEELRKAQDTFPEPGE